MKKLTIILFWIILAWLSLASAEYRIYDNLAEFEKEKWSICEAATDWCNSYFMKDGKVAWWTLMYCANKPVERSCTKFKDWVITTKAMPVSVINSGSIIWTVTKIENWKDWKQVYILWDDNTTYTTAVSVISDKITNWKYADIVLWAKLKVNYDDKTDDMLFWNSEEIVKSTLTSLNDINFYNNIKSKLDINSLKYVNSAIAKYKLIIEKGKDKEQYNKKVIAKIDKIISNFLSQFPQDKWLSDSNNTKYLKRTLLKFELQQLKF